jgi:hypothetical protein
LCRYELGFLHGDEVDLAALGVDVSELVLAVRNDEDAVFLDSLTEPVGDDIDQPPRRVCVAHGLSPVLDAGGFSQVVAPPFDSSR